MTVLSLGVVDIPYVDRETKAASRKRIKAGRHAPASGTNTTTTGDVAEILEAKYHVFEVFFEVAQNDIVKALEQSLGGALETALMRRTIGPNPYAEVESAIKERFDAFLTNREMEGLGYPGVPTQAAIDGVNHRFKHPYRKSNPRRPSFVDTGLYLASFVAEFHD